MFKEQFTPKRMLSYYLYDGKSGEMLFSMKHFWSFNAKHSPKQLQ